MKITNVLSVNTGKRSNKKVPKAMLPITSSWLIGTLPLLPSSSVNKSGIAVHATMPGRAAKLRPNWGQPYMLIGDMYASSSSSCGSDAWEKQIAVLAALDKYAYAKSIDSSVAEDANSKIARYSSYKPEKTGRLYARHPGRPNSNRWMLDRGKRSRTLSIIRSTSIFNKKGLRLWA